MRGIAPNPRGEGTMMGRMASILAVAAVSFAISTGPAAVKAQSSSTKVYHVGILFPALGPLFQLFRQEA
jgi:hypothetical protein